MCRNPSTGRSPSRRIRIACVVLTAIAGFALGPAPTAEAASRAGKFLFRSPATGKRVPVYYYVPPDFNQSSRIVFVMHGMLRNARKYRDAWIRYAKRYGFLLVVPEFSKREFPGGRQYNLGNMVTADGRPNNPSEWSFTVIEDLFDYVKQATGSTAPTYNIYGHSAGAQFVHRLVLFLPRARVNIAVAANAGSYAMPDEEFRFPFGLGGSPWGEKHLPTAFRRRLVVLLGTADTDPRDPQLPKGPGPDAQGRNRLSRGRHFFRTALETARREGLPLRWKLKTAPHIGHNNAKMARYAALLVR